MIEVVELSKPLEPRYSAFVQQHPRSSVYWTLEFRSFLAQILTGTPRYFVALDGQDIVGVLPSFVATHAEFGTVVNSLPWYGSHGACLVRPSHHELVRKALLDRYASLVGSGDVSFANLVLSPDENHFIDAYIAEVRPQVVDQRMGQITALPQHGPAFEAQLESAIWQKTRNLVRKACKQGFDLHIEDDDEAWRFLHGTHVENMAGIGGQAKPWEHFAAMRLAIPCQWRQLLVARLDGAPVAAMLIFRFNQTVEYITPVIKHEFRPLQPLSFLIWHGMLSAVRAGYRWWNWGGTWATQKSLHHFKAGWGAADQAYAYLVHARPHALEVLKRDRQAVANAFPFYFTYSFHMLE